MTLQCISSGLNIFGLDTSLTSMITGLVLIGTLAINFLSSRRGDRVRAMRAHKAA